MSTDFVYRFSSLFTLSPPKMQLPNNPQPWTSKIDVDAMIDAMAADRGASKVTPAHLVLIKQLMSSINFTPDHPVYPVMIDEAIATLNAGKGCSKDEISDFISTKYTVSPVVHLARLGLELDKRVRDKMIVFTSDNLYVAPTDENAASNAEITGGGRKRFKGGQRWKGGGSKMSKVSENVVKGHQNVGKVKQFELGVSADRGLLGEKGMMEGGNAIDDQEQIMAESVVPPGFDGHNEDQVGCRQVVSVNADAQGTEQSALDTRASGANDDSELHVQSVEAVKGNAQDANEEVSQPAEQALVVVHNPLEADDHIQPTALCCIPGNGTEGEDPAPVDLALNGKEDTPLDKLHKKTLVIKSCRRPLGEEPKVLQKKHDEVVNMIGSLSATVAKLGKEKLQLDEAGNRKQWFEEDQYKEILEQTKAVELALKEVMAKVREVNASHHTEAESSKGMVRRGKTKRLKLSPELDITPLTNSCPDKIQGHQARPPTILRFRLSPRSPLRQKHVSFMDEPSQSRTGPKLVCALETHMQIEVPKRHMKIEVPKRHMQIEVPKRELVCGLKTQTEELVCRLNKKTEEEGPRDRSSSQSGNVQFMVAKSLNLANKCLGYDMSWKCKRPRTRGPNVKEFSTLASTQEVDLSGKQGLKEVKIPSKESELHSPAAGNCMQMDLQLQIQDSSQPDQTLDIVTAQLSPSQLENELQDHGKAHSNELDVELVTGQSLDTQIPRLSEPGLRVRDLQGLVKDHISEDFGNEVACLDHQNHDEQQLVEGSHEGIPQLEHNSEATTVDSAEQGKQQEMAGQVRNQPEEQLKLQSEVSDRLEQPERDKAEACNEQGGLHQCQKEAQNLLQESDHPEEEQQQSQGQASNEGNHHHQQLESQGYSHHDEQQPPFQFQTSDQHEHQQQVEGEAFNQPEEELKLPSESCNQQEHHEHVQAEVSNQQGDQPQSQGEVHKQLEESDHPDEEQQQASDHPDGEQQQASDEQEQHEHVEAEVSNQQGDQPQSQGEVHNQLEESDDQDEEEQQASDVQEQQQHVQGQESSEQEEVQVETEVASPSVLESAKSMQVTPSSSSHNHVQKKHQQAVWDSGQGRLTRARATAAAAALSPPSLSTRNSKKQKSITTISQHQKQ